MIASDILTGKIGPGRRGSPDHCSESGNELTLGPEIDYGLPTQVDHISMATSDENRKRGRKLTNDIQRDVHILVNHDDRFIVYLPEDDVFVRTLPKNFHPDREFHSFHESFHIPYGSTVYQAIRPTLIVRYDPEPRTNDALALSLPSRLDYLDKNTHIQLPWKFFRSCQLDSFGIDDISARGHYRDLSRGDEIQILPYPPRFFYYYMEA